MNDLLSYETLKGRLPSILEPELARHRDAIGTRKTACAMQCAVGNAEHLVYSHALGTVDLETDAPSPVTPTTPFDIASLTKPLVGATLAMQAVDRGLVQWDTPLADFFAPWRERRDESARQITFLQILNHSSGLPAWHKYYLEHPLDPSLEAAAHTKAEVLQKILDTPLKGAPGSVHDYSDIGFILLIHLLETLFEAPLDHLARSQIFEPLALSRTRYCRCEDPRGRIDDAVVTEDCPLRKRVVRGTVHDENTNIIGGVSTHAGVFSTAEDLLTFGRHLLGIDRGLITDGIVHPDTLRFAWSEQAGSPAGHHLAGWDTPSGELSSAGRGFAPSSTVGHLGFTGTSIWIEREQNVVSVLFTNRVYPSRENGRIKALRRNFQEAVLPPSLDPPPHQGTP